MIGLIDSLVIYHLAEGDVAATLMTCSEDLMK